MLPGTEEHGFHCKQARSGTEDGSFSRSGRRVRRGRLPNHAGSHRDRKTEYVALETRDLTKLRSKIASPRRPAGSEKQASSSPVHLVPAIVAEAMYLLDKRIY